VLLALVTLLGGLAVGAATGLGTGTAAASPAPTDTGTAPSGVTGGAAGPSVVVTNLDDTGPGSLRGALLAGGGQVSFSPGLTGTIHLASTLPVPSNTTIDGGGAAVTIAHFPMLVEDVQNVIVRRLRFTAQVELVDSDALMISGSSDVWVDHNTFSNAADGLIDVVRGATRVTISWNRFEAHRKAMLLGANAPGGTPELVDISVHHNLLLGIGERNPMLRHGRFHVFNNVVDGWGSAVTGYAVKADCGADARIEANVFVPGADLHAVRTSEVDCDAARLPRLSLVDNDLRAGSQAATTALPSSLGASTGPVPSPAGTELESAVRTDAGWGASAPLPAVTAPGTTILQPTARASGTARLSASWKAVSGARRYQVQVFSCSFERSFHSENVSGTSYAASSLPGGCYVARVRAVMTSAPDETYTPWQVSGQVTIADTATTTTTTTTAPPAGDLRPVLAAKSASAVRLSWTAKAGADRYGWQIRTCTGTVVTTSDTAATIKEPSGLAKGCYRGFVRARVGGVYGAYEQSNELQLGSTVPTSTTTTVKPTTTTVKPTTTTVQPTTTTTSPSGAVLRPVLTKKRADAVVLSWTSDPTATRYLWRLLTCAGAVIVSSDTAAIEKTVSTLPRGCYRGEVKARRASGVGPAELTAPFTL
jgi:pectate lyase